MSFVVKHKKTDKSLIIHQNEADFQFCFWKLRAFEAICTSQTNLMEIFFVAGILFNGNQEKLQGFLRKKTKNRSFLGTAKLNQSFVAV